MGLRELGVVLAVATQPKHKKSSEPEPNKTLAPENGTEKICTVAFLSKVLQLFPTPVTLIPAQPVH
jgi:hypothetical protein